jgi:hypothetical protein
LRRCALAIALLAVAAGEFTEARDMPVYGSLFDGGDSSGFLGRDPRQLRYIEFPPDMVRAAIQLALKPEDRVLVGVIDSGVNPDHPQLAGAIVEARAFAGQDPHDRLGHGTAVAITALGPLGGRLLSARVTDDAHRPTLDAVIAALDWMAGAGARIINLSLGFTQAQPGVKRLCDKLAEIARRDDPPMFFIAAGNDPVGPAPIPAACAPHTAMVVASDEASSGKGDIVAPRPGSGGYVRYLVGKAEAAYAAKDRAGFGAALAALRSEAEASGRTADHHAVAQLAFQAGDLASALAAFDALVGLDPSDAEARYGRAAVLFRLARTSEASEAADAALALNPRHSRALWLAALARANLDDRAAALHALERLLAVEPEYPNGRALAQALQDEATPPGAILERFFEGRW